MIPLKKVPQELWYWSCKCQVEERYKYFVYTGICVIVWIYRSVNLIVFTFLRLINVSLPKKTRKNGTLYAMVFVHQTGMSPWQDPRQVHLVMQLTTYMLPKPAEVSLITGQELPRVRDLYLLFILCVICTFSVAYNLLFVHQQQESKSVHGKVEMDRPVSHWRTRLTLNIVSENFVFDRAAIPSDVHRYLRLWVFITELKHETQQHRITFDLCFHLLYFIDIRVAKQ